MGYLIYLFEDVYYTFADVFVFSIAIAILIKLLSILTPLKDWSKIKDNSFASAIVLLTILILFFCFTVSGWFLPE